MIKHCSYILCLAMAIQNISPALAQGPDFLTLSYDILSEGEDVGDVTLKLSQTEDGYLIVELDHIKTSGWWGDIDITSILSEEFQHGVGLVKADSKTLEDGRVHWTRISADEDMLRGKYTEITRMTAREKEQFPRLPAVTDRTSSKEKKEEEEKFPKDSFDTTFNDLPFYIQRNVGKPLPSQLNIMDTENLEIIYVSMSDLGLETIVVGTVKTQVRHLILSDGKFKPSHLWVREDIASLPYIVRHTGENEDGIFEIVLKAQQNLKFKGK